MTQLGLCPQGKQRGRKCPDQKHPGHLPKQHTELAHRTLSNFCCCVYSALKSHAIAQLMGTFKTEEIFVRPHS